MNGIAAIWARYTVLLLFLLASAHGQNESRGAHDQWTRLSEILISLKSSPHPGTSSAAGTSGDLAAAEARAEDARREIEAGSPFALVAIKYSDGPTAQDGGDLGYFKRGMLASQIEERASTLKLFQVSEVIRTKQGFVLIQVTDRRAGEENPTKEISNTERIMAAAYVDSVRKLILDKWYDLMPREVRAPEQKKGSLIVSLVMVNTGQVASMKVEQSSWNAALDGAATNAVKQAQPFPPFASEYGGCCLHVRINFLYNPPQH